MSGIKNTMVNRKLSCFKYYETEQHTCQHHREVVSVIIDCCKYLSEQMIAFRKKLLYGRKTYETIQTFGKVQP